MTYSINKVILLGNLGQDAEFKTMQNGKSMLSFSIATTESWKDKETQEWRNNTTWHNCVVFNERIIENKRDKLVKGVKIFLEGAFSSYQYIDNEGIGKIACQVVEDKIVVFNQSTSSEQAQDPF